VTVWAPERFDGMSKKPAAIAAATRIRDRNRTRECTAQT
jgi:hypothetical protein